MSHIKFTQEVKDNWIKALKSGKFLQGQGALSNFDRTHHCCLGVLGNITPGLGENVQDLKDLISPYDFLYKCPSISKEEVKLIIHTNDAPLNIDEPNFSNVIPLISKLKVEQ